MSRLDDAQRAPDLVAWVDACTDTQLEELFAEILAITRHAVALAPAAALATGLAAGAWGGFLGWWLEQTEATRARVLADPERMVHPEVAPDPDESASGSPIDASRSFARRPR